MFKSNDNHRITQRSKSFNRDKHFTRRLMKWAIQMVFCFSIFCLMYIQYQTDMFVFEEPFLDKQMSLCFVVRERLSVAALPKLWI